ncbi:MAG: DUF554 domain-containing protein [Leptolyngbyaceae cyanobacterium bins.59]|nr:DUF554 domain-containing protein [Leptolyngbyaceae cyanobacterium bins.59]
MTLDFWAKTSGTWMNAGTVFLGTGLGLLLRGRLPLPMQQIITQAVALITFFLGITMAGSLLKVQAGRVDGIILGLLSLVLGGMLGEWGQVEERLKAIGDWLKKRFRGGGAFTEGFVAASLLFCVGPMTLLGSLNNGLTGDSALLTLKAVMDGLTSIALTSSFGIGVGFSILIILCYQGGISLAAGLLASSLPDPATHPQVLLLTGVGGLMILGIGFGLLEVARVRVASFLPALVLAPLLFWLADWLS